jgi:cytidylate kinase
MSIVAVSETIGSQGDEIAREVARALGWQAADREIIAKAAEQYGEGVSELQHVTEERPTLWERFTDSTRHYLSYVEATVLEMAARDDVVLVGHGAAVMLQSVPHALRVRVNAPERVRAERIRQAQGLVESAALDVVRESDRERASRMRFLYHVDIDDPRLYDLVINTERLAVTEGAALVRQALGAGRLRPTPQGVGIVRDLALAAQAKARLLRDGRTRSLHVSATAESGRLTMAGTVDEEPQKSAVLEVVRAVPGVVDVVDQLIVTRSVRRFPGGV